VPLVRNLHPLDLLRLAHIHVPHCRCAHRVCRKPPSKSCVSCRAVRVVSCLVLPTMLLPETA
jgi:hypothetical protein